MPEKSHDNPDLAALAGEVAAKAREIAYVAVGLGVLGVQRAQVARRRLAAGDIALDSDERVAKVGKGVAMGAQQLADWLGSTVAFVGSSLGPLEEQIPEGAREVVGKARRQLQTWRALFGQERRPGA